MKQAKRLLALLLALVLCMALLPAALAEDAGTIAPAEEPAEEPGEGTIAPVPDEPQETYYGTCGENLEWFFSSSTGYMTISGSGEMTNYNSVSALPWNSLRQSIKAVVCEQYVTSIGDNAFYGCNNLTEVGLPYRLNTLGKFAFQCCTGLTEISFSSNLTSIQTAAFEGCTKLERIIFHCSAPNFGTNVFKGVSATAYYPADDPSWTESVRQDYGGTITWMPVTGCGSCGDDLFWTLAEGVLTISGTGDMWSFSISNPEYSGYKDDIHSVVIGSGVTEIGTYAFKNFSSLNEIRFLGDAPEFGERPFYHVTATVYYPINYTSWTEEVRLNYGGDLTWIPCRNGKPVNSFTDVTEGKYYYEPVLWAYYHDPQITGGTSETTFGPNKTCTREQIVTFLWKACGAPEPVATSTDFTDVKAGKYYYKAVLWAVEKGITGGVSETLFGVGRPCTREQAMTFLWKAAGSPAPTSTPSPFTDVKAGKYYYDAVMWAVQNGVTGGVSADKFGVGKTCTRGQIVTFLYAARGFLKT